MTRGWTGRAVRLLLRKRWRASLVSRTQALRIRISRSRIREQAANDERGPIVELRDINAGVLCIDGAAWRRRSEQRAPNTSLTSLR